MTEARFPQVLAPGVASEPEFTHAKEMFESDAASAHLGVTITHLATGHCEGEFTVREEMCNGHRTAHGGFLYAFADSLFAGACNSGTDVAVAAQNSIHYLAPAFAGDTVRGVARVVNTWGRNGIVDVELTKDGTTLAQFRGTFRVLPARPQQRD